MSSVEVQTSLPPVASLGCTDFFASFPSGVGHIYSDVGAAPCDFGASAVEPRLNLDTGFSAVAPEPLPLPLPLDRALLTRPWAQPRQRLGMSSRAQAVGALPTGGPPTAILQPTALPTVRPPVPAEMRRNPRRTSAGCSFRSDRPPAIACQSDRKHTFVDNLVGQFGSLKLHTLESPLTNAMQTTRRKLSSASGRCRASTFHTR